MDAKNSPQKRVIIKPTTPTTVPSTKDQSNAGHVSKRIGGESHYLRTILPGATVPSSNPGTPGLSPAFGLGSGAFASFGAVPRGWKGTAIPEHASDTIAKLPSATPTPQTNSKPLLSGQNQIPVENAHLLTQTWVIWFRPPTTKNTDYERSMIPLGSFATIEAFWELYTSLKFPSALPPISDYHLFQKGIRPIWEDEGNRRGGKWTIRLRKGVSDRCWERLIMTVLGNQFIELQEEICGVVLSVRASEDVLSIWTRTDGGRNPNIRDAIRVHLQIPNETYITFKSHDESMARRSTIDYPRSDASIDQGAPRRREIVGEDTILVSS